MNVSAKVVMFLCIHNPNLWGFSDVHRSTVGTLTLLAQQLATIAVDMYQEIADGAKFRTAPFFLTVCSVLSCRMLRSFWMKGRSKTLFIDIER